MLWLILLGPGYPVTGIVLHKLNYRPEVIDVIDNLRGWLLVCILIRGAKPSSGVAATAQLPIGVTTVIP